MITEAQLKVLAPNCKDIPSFTSAINKHCATYSINTTRRLAYFLGQYLYETRALTALIENTNYTSVERLMLVFPKYFPNKLIAQAYINHPEDIANRVYANRFGNGLEASGDGFRYRGRGLCHLTFKDNYAEASKSLGIDLVNSPTLLEKIDIAVLVGCWYWDKLKLNILADKQDIIGVTKGVNGGTNGLKEREQLTTRILSLLSK